MFTGAGLLMHGDPVVNIYDLRLEFEGGSIIDTGKNSLTLYPVGATMPPLSTSWSVSGSQSVDLTATTGFYVPESSLVWGTSDFTIRLTIKITAAKDGYMLLSGAGTTGSFWSILLGRYTGTSSDRLRCMYRLNGGGDVYELSGLPNAGTVGQTFEISLERYGSMLAYYCNRTKITSANIGANSLTGVGNHVFGGNVVGNSPDCLMDDVLIVIGSALAGGASSY